MTALLLIGFPIALILAWAFDVTPQGIQITGDTSGTDRRRNLILLIVAGAFTSATTGVFLLPRMVAVKSEKSIAVLPFENRSEDKANAYFAEGIQDEILTRLSKIAQFAIKGLHPKRCEAIAYSQH